MRVTICGHAGLLVESARSRILVDPIFADSFSGGAIGFAPARHFDLAELGDITLLVVSHGHTDHFHPATLRLFRRDTPVVVPDDAGLVARLEQLGFTDITVMEPWESYLHAGTRLLATPSAFEGEDEIGLLFESDGSSFWDTVDTIITPEIGARLRREVGPVGAVAARYQPSELLASYQRSLGMAFDYKGEVIDWLEAACAADPAFVFPYSFGVAYLGPHAWANRYAAPLSAPQVVRLLQARLQSPERAGAVAPGDVVEIDGSKVNWHHQASPFVHAIPTEMPTFEPIDLTTLPGLADSSTLGELRERLERFFVSTFQTWLRQPPVSEHVGRFVAWDVVWQLFVHIGGGERLHYAMDFRDPIVKVQRRRLPDANYFVHLDGESLLRVLRGEAESDLFWRCGAARFYETILNVRDARFWAPPISGWELFEQLYDPLTLCLRKMEESTVAV